MATSSKAKASDDNTDPSSSEIKSAEVAPVPEQSVTEEQTTSGKSVEQLVNEVLGGRYGDHNTARKRLADEGHDVAAVMSGVNIRISAGAPHAYKPTAIGLLQQVREGEWGDSRGLAQRLTGAGFSKPAVDEVLSRLDKE